MIIPSVRGSPDRLYLFFISGRNALHLFVFRVNISSGGNKRGGVKISFTLNDVPRQTSNRLCYSDPFNLISINTSVFVWSDPGAMKSDPVYFQASLPCSSLSLASVYDFAVSAAKTSLISMVLPAYAFFGCLSSILKIKHL